MQLLRCFFLSNCDDKADLNVKVETVTIYEAIENNGSYSKGKIKTKYSIGFHPNGSQHFFVGLVGYEGTKDTSFYEPKIPNQTKKEGNKSFIYTPNNEMMGVLVEKGDTTFFYTGEDLENPDSYEVKDGMGRVIARYEYLLGDMKTFTEAKYNDVNLCTYAIMVIDYIPTSYDLKFYNEIEIAQKTVERREIQIYEAEYEYYLK